MNRLRALVCALAALLLLSGFQKDPLDLPVLPPGHPLRSAGAGRGARPEQAPTSHPIAEEDRRVPFYGEEIRIGRDALTVFVLDKSSSMQGDRWARAKKETVRAVSYLDRWGVVVYDSQCPTWYAFEPGRGSVDELAGWLNAHSPLSSTDTASGVIRGLSFRPDRVVLLTDGEPNVHGPEILQPEGHRQIIRAANVTIGAQIDVFMIGDLGANAREFCHRVASDGGGTLVRVP